MLAMNAHLIQRRTLLAALLSGSVPVFLLLLGLATTGCKPETKAPPPAAVAGTYTLVSVNGSKVPATVAHDGVNLQVRSGTFTINADGTCGTKTTFVPPSGSETMREVKATYTQDGTKLTMKWQGAGTTVGTVAGSTFQMNNEGMVLTYQK
jgi:hypothetical protein